MVVDYRRVNAKTKRSVFLIPRGDDQKQEVCRAWLTTMLDAVWGVQSYKEFEACHEAVSLYLAYGRVLTSMLTVWTSERSGIFSKNDAQNIQGKIIPRMVYILRRYRCCDR